MIHLRTESGTIRYQADEHPLVPTEGFTSLAAYVLYLVHLVPYEEAASLAAGKDVLEVGCNNGYGTAIIARTARKVAGVDVSPRCIEEARERNAAENIDYRTIDGGRLPYDDASFDLAVSFQVIEHVFTLEPYLSEIRRVLKGGAMAIFTTPNACIRLDPGMRPWNTFHVREFQPHELESVLAPWFVTVTVKGLYAISDLYDVEFRRLQQARENARCRQRLERNLAWQVKRLLIRAAKAVLPPAARRLFRPEPQEQPETTALDGSSLARYSTRDFFYTDRDLTSALDLMAVCVR